MLHCRSATFLVFIQYFGLEKQEAMLVIYQQQKGKIFKFKIRYETF